MCQPERGKFMCAGDLERKDLVFRIHPLGTMNICTTVVSAIFQSGPKWQTDLFTLQHTNTQNYGDSCGLPETENTADSH